MTESLLQKLEEKMMILLAELENLRKETHRLKQENQHLKTEYQTHVKKLQTIVSLLDSMDGAHAPKMYHERERFEEVLEDATV